MAEQKKLTVLWVILAILLVGGLILASNVGNVSLNKELGAKDIRGVLVTFFVLLLSLSNSLEVFITAVGPDSGVCPPKWRAALTHLQPSPLRAGRERRF
jgi:hypothetical protein